MLVDGVHPATLFSCPLLATGLKQCIDTMNENSKLKPPKIGATDHAHATVRAGLSPTSTLTDQSTRHHNLFTFFDVPPNPINP
jgi:hypothetical protein